MTKLSVKIILTALMGLLLVVQAWGQPMRGAGGPGRGLDMSKMETLTGTIEAVNRIAPRRAQMPTRMQLLLKTDKETVNVFLGPADYVEQQGLKLAKGDQVQVKGVRFSFRQRTGIAAVEVQKGGQVLRLRDDTGRPLWPQVAPPPGAILKSPFTKRGRNLLKIIHELTISIGGRPR
jgi:hypothetical protein